jgi:hypothetical protein
MHTARRRGVARLVLAATIVTALAVGLTTTTAGATGGGSGPQVLVEGLGAPLHVSDAGGGKLLVSQSSTAEDAPVGKISLVDRKGNVTDLVTEADSFTGGAEAGPFGTVLYLSSGPAGALLKLRMPNGTTRTLADLGAYEARENPDQINSYGFQGLDQSCIDQLPPDQGLAPYTGLVDSNPYELALTPFGVLVADAAGNTLLHVSWTGRIRTVAVLPPRGEVAPPEVVEALGLPECVTGATFNFEPVPTDVEFGKHGSLFVSSLPGGPEDDSLGARGGVFRVNPWNGSSELVATGFLGATNLAVAPNGTIYVTELFGNRLSKVVDGGPAPVADLPSPAAVEWSRGRLLVTTDVFSDSGKIVELRG